MTGRRNADSAKCEIAASGRKVRVTINGQSVAELTGAPRTVPAFYVFGDGAELRVKDLKLEVLR